MRRAIQISLLLIISLTPFLSSCTGEVDQLIYFGKLWAMVHDITDADGNLNYGAAARFGGLSVLGLDTTGDDEADAAIDNAKILNKIRMAKEEGDKGWKELLDGDTAGDGMKIRVISHYDEAINLRPDDWAYRNERAIAHLDDQIDMNGLKAANADFAKANEISRRGGKPAEYLRILKHREQSLAKFVTTRRMRGNWLMGDVYRAQISLYDELYVLTSDKSYLLLKQQADSNLQSPHAERWDGK
jgi:hypothetical protein